MALSEDPRWKAAKDLTKGPKVTHRIRTREEILADMVQALLLLNQFNGEFLDLVNLLSTRHLLAKRAVAAFWACLGILLG